MKTLLLDLRDVVWNLKRQNAQLKELNEQGNSGDIWNFRGENEQLRQMNEELKKGNEFKDALLKAKIKEFDDQEAAMIDMATRFRPISRCRTFSWVVLVFVFGLCVGLMHGAM